MYYNLDLDEEGRNIFAGHEADYIEESYLDVGIVGSRDFEDENKIANVIEVLHKKPQRVRIVSGGCPKGADALAKTSTLALELPYLEFTPEFREPNVYSVQDDSEFGKEYDVGLYFKRNKQIAEFCDLIIAFIPEEYIGNPDKARGTRHTLTCARELNKETIVLA